MGDILGKKSDIADGSLRDWDFRKFNNLVGDYYVAPKFLDSMAVRNLAYTHLYSPLACMVACILSCVSVSKAVLFYTV